MMEKREYECEDQEEYRITENMLFQANHLYEFYILKNPDRVLCRGKCYTYINDGRCTLRHLRFFKNRFHIFIFITTARK